jgi:hypothetical protein
MPDDNEDEALRQLLLPTADGIPRSGDVTTLRSFVRLIRWQHAAQDIYQDRTVWGCLWLSPNLL